MITKEQIIDIAKEELTPIGWHEEQAKYIDGLDAFAERLVKLLTIPAVSGSSLMSEFWKESADLIEKYRDSGDERAAQGVVSCRILIDRLMKQLENDR